MSEFNLREMPDMLGVGKKKVYPKLNNMGRMTYEEVVEWMVQNCHVPAGNVRGVVSALSQTIAQLTARGHSVKIDGLGTFRARLGFAPDVAPEEMDAPHRLNGESFCVTGMNFRPEKMLLSEATRMAHLKRNRKTSKLNVVNTTAEERLAMLNEYLETHDFARVYDYWKLSGLSRSGATKELQRFAANAGVTGITTSGSGSHKVYVKK
jgi:predicted histone-like DNA-binding protein